MSEHNGTPASAHEEQVTPLTDTSSSTDELVGKAATIAVVGVGVALISAELLPGMLIGVAAAFLPGFGKRFRPLLKQTVRAGFTMVQKTRELVAEAGEQMQDMIAEAKAEHADHADPMPPASKAGHDSVSAGHVPAHS